MLLALIGEKEEANYGINRNYAAYLAAAVKNNLGTSLPGENPLKFLFLRPKA